MSDASAAISMERVKNAKIRREKYVARLKSMLHIVSGRQNHSYLEFALLTKLYEMGEDIDE